MRIALFPTCLVSHFRPRVADCAEAVLRRLGHQVTRMGEGSCCGQPAHSAGSPAEAGQVGRLWLGNDLNDADYVVIPSGSCTAMLRHHLQHYLAPQEQQRLDELRPRIYEFSEFLVDVLEVEDVGASRRGRGAYHASCHLLRDLGVRSAPLKLLQRVKGLELTPLEKYDECCGFGGVFSVLYPEVSEAMAADKIRNLQASRADMLILSDAGCLLQIEGALRKAHSKRPSVLHLAEVLAGRSEEAHG
ncbi:MAG TPA: (Fe-S)-binding protein [Acidobacteriota bacterium]|nr:(Fe-S)-binding protein [Acidobacteriota bacterium]